MNRENFKEKRKCGRFKVPFCVDCKHPDHQQDLSGVLKDVSMSGACVLIDSDLDLAADKSILLSLIFPDNALNVKAKIIWQQKVADKKKIGISFLNLPDSFRSDIYETVFKYHRDEITNKWWDF